MDMPQGLFPPAIQWLATKSNMRIQPQQEPSRAGICNYLPQYYPEVITHSCLEYCSKAKMGMVKIFTIHRRHPRNHKRAYRWPVEYHIHIWELSPQLSSAAVIALKHVGDCKINIALHCKYYNQQSLSNPLPDLYQSLCNIMELGQWRLKSRWAGMTPQMNHSYTLTWGQSGWQGLHSWRDMRNSSWHSICLLWIETWQDQGFHRRRPLEASGMGNETQRRSFVGDPSFQVPALIVMNKVCNRGFYLF